MPITLKTATMGYKDPTTGQYVGINSVNDADLVEQVQAVEDSIAPDYADLVFPVAAGQKCYHENILYEANQAIQTSEEWTAAHWSELTIDQDISALKSALSKSSNFTTSDIEDSTTAESVHAVGSHFRLNGYLYKATSSIAIGDTIVTTGANANCEQTEVCEELEDIVDTIGDVETLLAAI